MERSSVDHAEHVAPAGRVCLGTRARAALTLALLAPVVTAGCVSNMDPKTARDEFSSKERSMAASGVAIAPRPSRVREADPANLVYPTADEPARLSSADSSGHRPNASPVATLPTSVRTDAESILRQASRNAWAALRAHAIEASASHPALLAEFAPRGLADENRGVRFVACMAIAQARATALAHLVEPLLADDSASVRAGAMLALTRTGRTVDLSPLASMIVDPDPEIRANAYLVLGELGNRSAIPLIRESLGQGMGLLNPLRVRLVGLAAAEALVRLGDETQIEPIRAALFAPPQQAELTIVACDAIGRLGDEIARPMLERLVTGTGASQRAPEVRIAAARGLAKLTGGAKIGSEVLAPGAPRSAQAATFEVVLGVAKQYIGDPDSRIRAQVATLLAEIGSTESSVLLAGLFRDGDPVVQVAAAGGLDLGE